MTLDDARRLASMSANIAEDLTWTQILWELKAYFPEYDWDIAWGSVGEEPKFTVKERT